MDENMTSMERMFIDAYRQMPNLWDVDHRDYNKKDKRNESYDTLLTILRTYVPNAIRMNVRQKINILRSAYRKELRKYLASKYISPEGEIVYAHKPTSWKFEAMKFLDRLDDEDASGKLYYNEEVVIEDSIEDNSLNELEEQELEFVQEFDPDNEEYDNTTKIIVTPITPDKPSVKNPIRVSRKRVKSEIDIEAEIISRECNAIGSNVACKLQRMNSQQRYHAEALINKVLMTGLQDKLSEDTDLMDACYVHKTENVEC